MNGKRAKEIRRKVYGDLSLRGRKYYKDLNGCIIADSKRQEYQKAKKDRR